MLTFLTVEVSMSNSSSGYLIVWPHTERTQFWYFSMGFVSQEKLAISYCTIALIERFSLAENDHFILWFYLKSMANLFLSALFFLNLKIYNIVKAFSPNGLFKNWRSKSPPVSLFPSFTPNPGLPPPLPLLSPSFSSGVLLLQSLLLPLPSPPSLLPLLY